LPSDYLEFLNRTNGGVASGQVAFHSRVEYGAKFSGYEIDSLREFFRVADIKSSDQHPETVHYWFVITRESLPPGVLPVAICFSDSLICLNLAPEDFGTVYYWDWYFGYPWSEDSYQKRIEAMRNRDDEEEWNWIRLTRVAGSFSEFLENLFQEDVDG
jgi:hypothetical protein